jgi:outer membrane protein, heavy metal efflux system
MKRALYLLFVLAALPTGFAGAQSAAPDAARGETETITFGAFLDEVLLSNLDYAAERYNVPIAEALRAAARVFPNPQLELGYERDVTHHGRERMPEARAIGITQTFELGGKRKARVRVAELNVRAAAATLDEFLRGLRLDAASAFAQTLAAQHAYEQKLRSAAILDELLVANEQRLRVGDVGEVDVTQIRIEALQLRNEALASEADARAAQIAMTSFLGRERAGTALVAVGNLVQPSRNHDLQQLLAQMLAERSDLVALRHLRDAAGAEIELARAGRLPDLDIGVGMTRSSQSLNSIAPSPEFDAVGISFSLPIPLFNQNRGEISAAVLRFGQARRALEAAEQKAEADLRSAHERYRLAAERLSQFLAGALKGADEVLEAKRYSYQRGQTALLDFLEAQRAASELHLGYYDAMSDQAEALIDLERAAGLWGIDF